MQLELTKTIVDILTFGITVGAITIGLLQYWRAQRWKVLEFIAAEVKEFENDSYVANVFDMLDYSGREVELFPEATDSKKRWIAVDTAKLIKALKPHTMYSCAVYDDDDVAIRDAFDVFLHSLDRFHIYIETGLVRYTHLLPHLRYWLDILKNPKNDMISSEGRAAIRLYMKTYHNDGALKLLDAYEPQAS